MGNLAGHVIPGVFFIIYGSWWCFNSILLHLGIKTTNARTARVLPRERNQNKTCLSLCSEHKHDLNLSRKSWIPMPYFPRIPVEPILKIIFASAGIFVEAFMKETWKNSQRHIVLFVYHIRNEKGELNGLGKLHHITLYGSFLISGIVDLLSICVHIPWPTSTLFLSLSFLVEATTFYFHTMERDIFDVTVHSMLVYIILSCIAFSLLRLYSPSNLVINLGLGSSILFQGTWFIQLGYFLYGGFVKDISKVTHWHLMFVAACFTWHLLFIALGNLLLWLLLALFASKGNIFKKIWKQWIRGNNLISGRERRDITEERSKLVVSEESEGTTKGEVELQDITST